MTTTIIALIILGGIMAQVFIPGFPKETLLLLAGVNFGLVGGALINWVGMILGAQIGYEVVRYSMGVGGRFAQVLEAYHETKFVTYLRNRGNMGLFFVRLIPYAPNDVLSLASGALYLPRRGFAFVSVITALPYAIAFAYLGYAGTQFFGQQYLWAINAVVFAISAIGVAIYYVRQKPRETSN